MTVRTRGLNLERSYSSSSVGFCFSLFFTSLSAGPWNLSVSRVSEEPSLKSYPGYPHAEMDKSIHCILLGHGEPCMLIEPSPILVWHAFSVLNVQCDYADFV